MIFSVVPHEPLNHRFDTAHENAARLLQDRERRSLVEAALEQQEDKQSLEWLASNIVSWFSQRIRGDHHIFTRDGVVEILNLQPRGSLAKAYQVRQVRNVIVQYRLAEGQDAE
jgi:hypothetical protein